MVWKALVIVSTLLIAGCDNSSNASQMELTLLRNRVDVLEGRIERLGYQVPSDFVSFKPTDKHWQWIGEGGIQIRVGIDRFEKTGNGTKLRLAVVSPQAVALKGCTLGITWAETDKSGAIVQPSKHYESMMEAGDFPAGGFAMPAFDLADIAPEKLGHIAVSNLRCDRTSA